MLPETNNESGEDDGNDSSFLSNFNDLVPGQNENQIAPKLNKVNSDFL